jgi:hypothetical protein
MRYEISESRQISGTLQVEKEVLPFIHKTSFNFCLLTFSIALTPLTPQLHELLLRHWTIFFAYAPSNEQAR